MSSGYAANCAWTMSWENIKGIVPKEAKELEELISPHNISIDDICHAYQYEELKELCEDYEGDCDDFTDSVEVIVRSLTKEFKKITHLDITFYHHDMDNEGDVYDDVSGGYFVIDGVEELTLSGEKYQEILQKSMWVGFG